VSVRVRLAGVLAGMLVLAGVFGVQGSFGASIVLSLTQDANLELRLDNGARIRTSTPQTTIAPGTYSAVVISEVADANDDYHMFHLTGPGVNLQTDLLAGDERAEPHVISLQPNSVYTFRDDRNTQLGSIVFSTSGAGNTVSAGSSGGPSGAGSGGTISNVPTTSNKDVVGSKVLAMRGTLTAGVDTSGKPTLLYKGKAVGSLKAGRYTFTLRDETSRAPFVLRLLNKQPQTLSGKAFVGRRTVTVALKAGQWMYYASPGKKTFFLVHA
jgi:hypothetical protein